MRIAVASDLHYDPRGYLTKPELVKELAVKISHQRPDAIVLAGDLSHGRAAFEACVGCFRNLGAPVAVLAGNHDIWKDEEEGFSSEEMWGHLLEMATLKQGALWLEKQNLIVGDVGIVGSLAWYDYSAVDPDVSAKPDVLESMKACFNNDATWIDWKRTDREFAKELNQAMLMRLQSLAQNPQVRAILVVTHVPIVEEQMERKPGDSQWGLTNAYFGNLTLGREVLKEPKVKAIVSGHTHIGKQEIVKRAHHSNVDVRVVETDYGEPGYTMITL